MAIREGRWDCPSCGNTGIRGPQAECPACGAPRGADVPFYLPEDAPEVSDPEAVKRAKAGADWTCPYCDGDNPASAELCVNCNAPRDGATRRAVSEDRHGYGPSDPPPPPSDQPVFAGTPPSKKPGRRSGRLRTLGCLGLVALALLFVFWLTRTEPATVTVTGLRWERSVEVQERRVERGEAWEDEVPEGAEVFARWQEGGAEGPRTRTVTERVQVGTERVKVGVRDLGNGYFEDVYEERPVYETVERTQTVEGEARTRVRYQVERWSPARTERASGDERSPPAWPALRLGPDEREGERREAYTVLFAAPDGRTLTYRARDEAEWRRFEIGRPYRAEVRGDRVRSVHGPG